MTQPNEYPTVAEGDPVRASDMAFALVRDDAASVYNAVAGNETLGGVTYEDDGDHTLLLATAVYPEYRHRGVATELIRRVLDDIEARGRTVIVVCPIVRTFIHDNPRYAGLVRGRPPETPAPGGR